MDRAPQLSHRSYTGEDTETHLCIHNLNSCIQSSNTACYLVLNVKLSVCLQAVVRSLLSETEDMALLISRFQEFLEMDDVRYYVMSAIRDNITKVMEKNKRVGLILLMED